jgi:transcriptional regulator with XRE-family HTH domain
MRIKALREASGLSQAKCAARADLDPSTWNRIEQGQGNPSLSTLTSIAEALGVEVPDLFDREAVTVAA